MCQRLYKLIALSLAFLAQFLAISSFHQLMRCETDMVMSYRIVPYLQCCYAWVVTSNAVLNYWKCYINVVTWTCLGLYWHICTLPWVLHALGSHGYMLVKPLAAMLQYIIMYTVYYYLHHFFHIYLPLCMFHLSSLYVPYMVYYL